MSKRSNTIEQEFDGKAAIYDHYRLAPWYQAQGEAILDVIDPYGSPVFLDIGCGTGWLLRRILDRFPEASGYGLDLSGRMIEVAKEKSQDPKYTKLSFLHADWEDMNAADMRMLGSAGITHVIAASVFHYFSDPRRSSAEMFDVLEPGGRVLIMERAKDGSLPTYLWGLAHTLLIKDNVQFYRSGEIAKILSDAGFVDVDAVWRLNKLFWKQKLYTGLALLSGRVKQ